MPLSEAQPSAISQVYAHSLYDLATKGGGRDAVESTLAELEDVLEIARTNPSFGEFLSSRAISAKEREASIDKIFKGRASDLVVRFLKVLNSKQRLGGLPSIVAAFDQIVQEKFGRVEVDVITAEPLPADELNRVRDRLAKSMGKDVVVHPYVEEGMLGGVKFRIGDQLIDASLSAQLRQMKDQIQNQGIAALRARMNRAIEG